MHRVSRVLAAVLLFVGLASSACKSREDELREQRAQIAEQEAELHAKSARETQERTDRKSRELAAEQERLEHVKVLQASTDALAKVVEDLAAKFQSPAGPAAASEELERRSGEMAPRIEAARRARAALAEGRDAGSLAPVETAEITRFERAVPMWERTVCEEWRAGLSKEKLVAHQKLCEEFRRLVAPP